MDLPSIRIEHAAAKKPKLKTAEGMISDRFSVSMLAGELGAEVLLEHYEMTKTAFQQNIIFAQWKRSMVAAQLNGLTESSLHFEDVEEECWD